MIRDKGGEPSSDFVKDNMTFKLILMIIFF